jgi:chromosomal replication initiator protein
MNPNYPRVRWPDILRVVMARYSLTPDLLRGPRRCRRIARPRQIAMYFGRALTANSYPKLGQLLGGRDHTTIIHGERRIRELAGGDAGLEIELNAIEREILAAAERSEAERVKLAGVTITLVQRLAA